MTTLTIDIPEELRERAEAVAASNGETLHAVLLNALSIYAHRTLEEGTVPARNILATAAREAESYYTTDKGAREWVDFVGDSPEYA